MRWLLVAILVVSVNNIAQSQSKTLQQLISIDVKELPLKEVILILQEQSGTSFAYNPNALPLESLITYKSIETSLQDVLLYISNTLHLKYEYIEKQIALLPDPMRPPLLFNLSGNINDTQSGESLIGATLRIDNLAYGTISNGYGFYSLNLPYGKHLIEISYLGFATKSDTINLVGNMNFNFGLDPGFPELDEVIVRGYKPPLVELIQTGLVTVSPKSISESPAAFGEGDVIKSLEKIPGIRLQSEGSTFFYVRGGNKDQNLILIDDAPIYNPSHMLGLFSTIIPETANSINVYKSDFPLAKGGRLSSVIDIKTKEGNKNRISGWGNIGFVSTQLGIEGPLQKKKSSFLLSGRSSHIKWFFKQDSPDLEKFHFNDVTGKLNFELGNRNKIYFSMYAGSDQFINENSGLGWSNINGSVRWNKVINENSFVNTTLYGSNYKYQFITNSTKNESWRSRIGEIGFKTDFTHFIKANQEVSWGFNLNGRTINPGNLVSDEKVDEKYIVSVKNNIETAGYFQHAIRFGNHWGIKYGARASLWTSIGEAFEFGYDENGFAIDTVEFKTGVPYHNYFQLEPRLSVSYFITKNSSIKASYDRTAQNLHLISNTISPFTSFEIWLPSGPNIEPQTSNQVALGYYHFLQNTGISLQAELYYKALINQIDYESHAATLLNPTIESELLFGQTKAYGLELFAKKEEGKFRGMVGYTLSKVKSKFEGINNGKLFTGYADRPHNIAINANYDITPRITLSSNFIYISGIPFSTPTSFYLFDGNEIPVYEKKNNSRLPSYHRLDVSAKFILNKDLAKRFRHSLIVSIYNLYGRKNPIFINFNKSINGDGDFEVPTNLLAASRLTTQTYIYGFAPSINYQFRF